MCNQRIVRTQPIWLGETLLTHHVFTCREFSWTDILGLSSHRYSDFPGRSEVHQCVHAAGNFGVCSQLCVSLCRGDSHAIGEGPGLPNLTLSEKVLS